jgi:hypothetical protein
MKSKSLRVNLISAKKVVDEQKFWFLIKIGMKVFYNIGYPMAIFNTLAVIHLKMVVILDGQFNSKTQLFTK